MNTPRKNRRRKPSRRELGDISVKVLPSDPDHYAAIARVATAPEVQHAITVRAFAGVPTDELKTNALIVELTKQGRAANTGDLSQGERMLAAQAHALDAIFGECVRRARTNMGTYTQTAELYLRVGLKAQTQCRATWETLAAMKNPPPFAFVRQANIAHGPQQVNNAPTPATSRAGENGITPDKLLEASDGERMDTRTAGAASGGDQALAPVGAIDRVEDNCGQG